MGAYFTLFLGRLQLRIAKNYKKTFRPQQRAECFFVGLIYAITTDARYCNEN
jgi:hypothetical protein